MQIDFHYGIIKILAVNAGFSRTESELIAYASQYVDDATDHKQLTLNRNPGFVFERLQGNVLDPVCTAHKGLQFLNDLKNDVQEKIYLAFHFIPPFPYTGQHQYDYVVRKDSQLINRFLERIFAELKKQRDEKNLIALGIALHSYADTWSHSLFSGIYNPKDNDIDEIKVFDGKDFKKISTIEQIRNNFLPSIGHAEAMDYPDLPFIKWSFVKEYHPGKVFIKDNPKLFLEAAEKIYQKLCNFNKCNSKWKNLQPKLWKIFNFISYEPEERLWFIEKNFEDICFHYNENKWKNDFLKKYKFTDANFEYDYKNYWLYFHSEAIKQRKIILSMVKPLGNARKSERKST